MESLQVGGKEIAESSNVFDAALGEDRASAPTLDAVTAPFHLREANAVEYNRGFSFDVAEAGVRKAMDVATDRIKRKAPLFQHVLLDRYRELSGRYLSPEVKRILRSGLKTESLRLYHSEGNKAMSELLLVNCRDTRLEKCVDSAVTTQYLLKQNYDFYRTPTDAGFMLTSHLNIMNGLLSTESSIARRYASSEFSYLKNAATGSQALLKNCVRYLTYNDALCDAIHQTTARACPCAFTYHRNPPTGGLDEFNNPETVQRETELKRSELINEPYACHVLHSAKNFMLYRSKVNLKQRGDSLVGTIKRLAESGMGSHYEDFFVPTRASVENCSLRPAGVNLNVIVNPNNLTALSSRASCFHRHFCLPDLLKTTAVAYGEALQMRHNNVDEVENDKRLSLPLSEIALPPNVYAQYCGLNPALVFICNALTTAWLEHCRPAVEEGRPRTHRLQPLECVVIGVYLKGHCHEVGSKLGDRPHDR